MWGCAQGNKKADPNLLLVNVFKLAVAVKESSLWLKQHPEAHTLLNPALQHVVTSKIFSGRFRRKTIHNELLELDHHIFCFSKGLDRWNEKKTSATQRLGDWVWKSIPHHFCFRLVRQDLKSWCKFTKTTFLPPELPYQHWAGGRALLSTTLNSYDCAENNIWKGLPYLIYALQ